MVYINLKENGSVETIDEFESYKDAKLMIVEYCIAFNNQNLYLSQRPTTDWRNKQ